MVWLRRAAWGVGAVLLLWAVAWLGVPPLLKWQAQTRLTEALGRPVTLDAVRFQPWNLQLTVTGLTVGAAPGAAAREPLLQVASLFVDAGIGSLWHLAPVVEALQIESPRLRVARTAEGHYDIDDLIARFSPDPAAPPAPPGGEPARFALYNLQLHDARLRFDDQPVGRVHEVDGFTLGLPFLSNQPALVQVTVEPRLAFKLNGAAFDSGAAATPFESQRRGELKLAFSGLDLVNYLGYQPESLPVRVKGGVLSSDLALRFALPDSAAPTVVLSGSLGLRDLATADADGNPVLSWKHLTLGLRELQPLQRQLAFGALGVEGAHLRLSRDAAGTLSLARLARPTAPASAPVVAAPASAAASGVALADTPWRIGLDSLQVDGARVDWADAAVQPAAALVLDGIAVKAQQLQWPVSRPMPVSLAAQLRAGGEGGAALGSLSVDGTVTDTQATLKLQLADLALEGLAPYLAQALQPRVAGTVALQGQLDWSGAAEAPQLQLQLAQASLDGLRVSEGSGRGAVDALGWQQLRVADARIDLRAHTVVLGKVALQQPRVLLARDAAGQLNLQRWAAAAPAAAAPVPTASAPVWSVQLADLTLDAGLVQLADSAVAGRGDDKPLRADLSQIQLRLQDLAWPGRKGAAPTRLQLTARLGSPTASRDKTAASGAGSLAWNGKLGLEPLAASGTLRAERLPVHLFEPYFGAGLGVSLLRAEAGYTGTLAVLMGPAGPVVDAAGDVRVADLRVHTRADASAALADTEELLSWQSLALNGVKLALKPPAKPRVEVREAVLSDFYSRLVITEQGRFNLQDVAAAPAAPGAAASAPALAVAASAPAVPASAPAADLPLDLSIGGTRLVNGRVDFSDRFVRPNYSADLSELNGRLGAFRSGTREMATLELRGRAAGTALLDISGQLNPTADPLALDIRARATDLELAPFSPYAGKYAGYAIERGKLSMDVSYKITPEGALDAKNQVVLNQLTFGEKVESPDATKLPVLLAVALLKDRNGVIDINLPVSGSINDPQFSVGGIIVKVIVNLLVKAFTAPFALLAGGGSDDLSLVEFRPGTALVTDAGDTALEKVAKALEDRPALKMTVTGAADPVSEREAFQRSALEARLRAERKRELLRGGASADVVVTMNAEERAQVLKEVYRQTDLPNKPRNAIGMARDIAGPEMEALLLPRTQVSTEAMRELALQRGVAVRDALIAKGLPSERLFLAAPKLRASGEDDAAWTPRVQLSLGTN